MKGIAWTHVKSRRSMIRNANEFVVSVAPSTNIHLIGATEKSISDAIDFVKANETFEHAPRLLGISTDHNWTSTDDAELLRAPVTSSFVSDVFLDGTNKTSAYAPGQVCIVTLKNKNNSKKFLAFVCALTDQGVVVRYLRQESPCVFVTKVRDEESCEPVSAIHICEPQPIVDRHGKYVFERCPF